MERKHKLIAAKAAVVVGVIPILLWAHEYGPDAGYCGVPGENGTCAQSGCHLGTANDPANRGGVSVAFPNGTTYTAGVKQHLVVTVADPATTQKAWGFELTARDGANPASQAGTFQSTDANTQLMCASANLFTEQPVNFTAGGAETCPANMPLQYVEHSLTGYTASRGKTGSFTYEFDWTPPSGTTGNITLYLAGNAANGDLTTAGDHIYTNTYTLTPSGGSTGGGPAPAIAAGKVLSAASGQAGVVPGSYVAIYGSNLAPQVDNWNSSIVNGNLPTAVDNVRVMIGGKPAYVFFISPGQINVIAPDVPAGPVDVQVINAGGASATVTGNAQPYGPAFFPWPGNYAVATHADFSWAVKPGVFAGVTTVPAKPGEVIILWGTGFGPTNPTVPIGTMPPATAPAVVTPAGSPLTVTVGGASAEVIYAVLSGYPGLYQIAIRVPTSLPDGDAAVKASIGAAQSADGVMLTVRR